MSSSDDPLALLREPKSPPAWRERLVRRLEGARRVDLARLRRALGLGALCLVAAGLVWWSLRPPSVPVEARLPVAAPEAASQNVGVGAGVSAGIGAGEGGVDAAGSAQPLTQTTAAATFVHVAGAVREPGLVVVGGGARVIDAIEAAGGVTDQADVNRINLAALVIDGQRLFVPTIDDPAVPAVVSGGGGAAGSGNAPVDLNAATPEQLEALPGVGPATAAAIVSHRDNNGPFESVVDLLDVPGIGDAKLAALRDLVSV